MGVLVDFLQHQHARLALELGRYVVGECGANGVVVRTRPGVAEACEHRGELVLSHGYLPFGTRCGVPTRVVVPHSAAAPESCAGKNPILTGF